MGMIVDYVGEYLHEFPESNLKPQFIHFVIGTDSKAGKNDSDLADVKSMEYAFLRYMEKVNLEQTLRHSSIEKAEQEGEKVDHLKCFMRLKLNNTAHGEIDQITSELNQFAAEMKPQSRFKACKSIESMKKYIKLKVTQFLTDDHHKQSNSETSSTKDPSISDIDGSKIKIIMITMSLS
jgi:hypothetical protein